MAAELDFSSIWSWTIPLWGLFVIVLFLGGILADPPVLIGSQAGGGRALIKTHARK